MSSLATSRLPEPTTIPWAPETGDLSVSGYALVEVRADGSFGRSRLLPDAVPAGEVTAVRTALAFGDWSEVATTLVTSHAVVRLLAGTADAFVRSTAGDRRGQLRGAGVARRARPVPWRRRVGRRGPRSDPVHRWGQRTRAASSRDRLHQARPCAAPGRRRRGYGVRGPGAAPDEPAAGRGPSRSSPSSPSCSTRIWGPCSCSQDGARGRPHPRSWRCRVRGPSTRVSSAPTARDSSPCSRRSGATCVAPRSTPTASSSSPGRRDAPASRTLTLPTPGSISKATSWSRRMSGSSWPASCRLVGGSRGWWPAASWRRHDC